MKQTLFILLFILFPLALVASETTIDRKTVVGRHNVVITEVNSYAPLSVGNGKFCHTVDITGMQTFPELYREGIPLSTMSEWGWHSYPNPKNYKSSDVLMEVDTYGRKVKYPIGRSPGFEFLRADPHQSTLALIGLQKTTGVPLSIGDVSNIHQSLNLWEGTLQSNFSIDRVAVEVSTLCHPVADQLAYRIESSLLEKGNIGVQLRLPYTSGQFGKDPAQLDMNDLHYSEVVRRDGKNWTVKHQMDNLIYFCHLTTSADVDVKEIGAHTYLLTPTSVSDVLTLSVDFSRENINHSATDYASICKANVKEWERFWMSGGAIDLSESKDDRWKELERRIVLSQYLTAIQSRQQYPPQETGLTCNSWYGKFHLEMHWWHSVHFGLWGRSEYLANTLDWYGKIADVAKEYTQMQGYKGIRWPKMIGPEGIESPSGVGPLLIWQQPHFIYYCEMLYRDNPSTELLRKFVGLIEATAEFMADYAHWDKNRKCYVLGPPLISAREGNHLTYQNNINPAFELVYWSWGLRKANDWLERAGRKRNEHWDRMASSMSPLPVVNGVYVEAESVLEKDDGHPTQLAAYGFLPQSELIDKEIMRKTLYHVMNNWSWGGTWGWDYPLVAMTAARLGESRVAIDALLKDVKKNNYLPNGHNFQDVGLPIYLPGNGGLLTVIAMMCAGWDGAPKINAPGFPQDGSWTVKWEGMKSSF